MAIEPEDLLPHFERELGLLRRSTRTFAELYPKIAARLAMSGEHSDDPHVERLLQSFALMCARHDIRLEDEVPEFTHALIDTIHGAFLRPFPSCAMAQFRVDRDSKQTEPRIVPRGTQLVAPNSRLVFRTAADVTLVPLTVSGVRYATSTVAPMQTTLPADTTGILSFTLELTAPSAQFSIAPDMLRLHLAGEREVVAALADGVLMHATRAFVELDGNGRWRRMDMPLAAAGFDDADALLAPPRDNAIAPFHLLMEYGAFPARFDNLDLNLARLKRLAVGARRITLHLALAGIHPDSRRAQRLIAASADNLRLFCTPVVNLFSSNAEPIETKAGQAYYALKPFSLKTAATTEIWSVDQVRITTAQGAALLAPFESLQHALGAAPGPYWIVLRDEARRAPKLPFEPGKPGQEALRGQATGARADGLRGLELALVNARGEPVDPAAQRQLDIVLSCTNGNLADMRERQLAVRDGDSGDEIELLAQPSASPAPILRRGDLWELLSWLVPQAARLNAEELNEFKRFCTRFDMSAPDAGRRFDALVSLSTERVRRWMPGKPASAFVQGLEVRLVIDEQRFVQFSLAGLGRVMDRLFSPYVPVTSFVQIVLVSAETGAVLRRGEPCAGSQPLI
ncbi:type VI secretion system baseplate subunit TssF [Burkholderia vietnamiensis]|uniref:type VI secretion system baseplate subunit TssF n=1 Tax=Burkholderia vietnamiensis TaxID=60552 RepID=UPI000757139A|nr:type VI secretion system baseplate subunit TssF [Burkholderia vietnamiensis]KVE71959.1 type VI secretion protein [Burkholderia vietnamiensis]MBR7977032.1 type VI secretion system baseplate subunit TssF [Burkholderia vietnamiensis]HDR9204395.1 type VI secretion system baseplate subunit TssF [Burkholderia vietnamiensis]